MNKKYIKLFAVSALTFFASLSLVNAKTYTKLEDLVKDVETWREKENKENNEDLTDGYIYVVGNYVFTSNYSFKTLNDLADAWQSIPTGSKTYIYEIKRIYDEETYEPTGWDIKNATNLFKNGAKLPDLMNVYYLDKELTQNTVNSDDDVKLLVEKANAAVNNKENKDIYGAYELAYDEETRTITVNTKKNLALNSIKNSDVVATLYSILTKGAYSSIKIGTQTINARTSVGDIKITLGSVLGGLVSKHLVDLTKNQPIKVSFTPANGIKNVADVDGKLEYTIKFTAEVDTNSYFEIVNDSSNYALTCDKVDGELCTPVLNITNNAKYDGLRLIVYTVNKGLTVGSKKAIMTITSSTKTKEIEFTTTDTDANKKLINDAIKEFTEVKNYSDLEGLTISLKFEADTEKGYTFANGETTVVYNFVIGSYIDLNSVIEKTTMPSEGNANLIISEDGKTINVNIPLDNNKFDSSNLSKNIDDLQSVLTAIKGSNNVTKVTINGKEFNNNLETIVKDIIDAEEDISFDYLLKMNTLTVEVIKNDAAKFIPTATNASGNKATYKVNLVFTGADLTMIRDNFEVKSNDHLKAEFDESGTVLTVDLIKVNDTVAKISGTTIIKSFIPVYEALKSVSINGAAIDFASLATAEDPMNALKEDVLSKLGISKDTLLKDLVGKEYTVKMVLNDKVKPNDGTESELEFTLKFVSSAIVELTGAEGEESLAELVKNSSSAEIIYLSKDYVVPNKGTLTIENDNLVIKGDGESVITGNVVVTGKNVTLDNVIIDGVNNLGTQADETNQVFVLNASNATDFTLTNSKLSYDKDVHYAYGMVKVGGKVVITGNTIDITNVKNPIEFDGSKYAADGTNISGNHFTGNNYNLNKKAGETVRGARNVISIYGVESSGAIITIDGNTFDYANWAVRISHRNAGNAAIYKITNNTVVSNKAYTTDREDSDYLVDDGYTAFVGLESETNDLSNVVINYSGNTANGTPVKHIAEKYTANNYDDFDRFAWTDQTITSKQAKIVG